MENKSTSCTSNQERHVKSAAVVSDCWTKSFFCMMLFSVHHCATQDTQTFTQAVHLECISETYKLNVRSIFDFIETKV